MSEACSLYVAYLTPPSYWAEDYEPPFMGDPGFYVSCNGDVISGPYETKAEAETERRYMMSLEDAEVARRLEAYAE